MKLIDAHCHLEAKDFPNVDSVLDRARAHDIVHAVVVGLLQHPGDFGQALELARRHPDFLSATMGIHPHDAARATESDWNELERRCALPEVVAVGEAGLDYYYEHSGRDIQRKAFARQCQLALANQKPIVVHVRDAHSECYDLLRSAGVRDGVIHCFTGDVSDARRYLDLGLYLSISGIVTYKKTEALAEAVRFAPIDRLLVETDTPYLAPVPHRGKQNEPSLVHHTAARLAEIKAVDQDRLASATRSNTVQLFRLPSQLRE